MPQNTGSDDTYSWLALHLVPGLGGRSVKRLVDRLGSPEQVLEAGLSELKAEGGLREEVARRVREKVFFRDPERELREARRLGARIMTFSSPSYPRSLRLIPDPPMVVYLRGLDIPRGLDMVGVVGSRTPTPYGIRTARELGSELASLGVGVVSGMARGVDGAAHRGALDAGGFTVAVLGTGVDRVYPHSHRELFASILDQGTVVSEFPLGTPPDANNFPRRNRIVSGLSLGVVIVEAARKSGSLITAAAALDQGREVFAVPGSIRSHRSAGCHFLLKQGAFLAESAKDVVEVLGLACGVGTEGPEEGGKAPRPEATMAPDEAAVYGLLGVDPVHIDELVKASKMSIGGLLSLLTRMELTGLIEQLPGKMFVRL
jgi:DNA processing protein